jgi:hypothetical protein
MAKKLAWHTDIVIDGQGFGLSIRPNAKGCYSLYAKPDTPGERAGKAAVKLTRALTSALRNSPPTCSAAKGKRKVTAAIRAIGARWNQWHQEQYK